MKHLKIFGLLALITTLVMVWAATASATRLTSPLGTTYTGKIKATSEGHVTIHGLFLDIECSSALEGEVKTHGPTATSSIQITSLSFPVCTKGWTPTVNFPGYLEIHHVPGTNDGTVTWSGATISFVSDSTGLVCRYSTKETHVGTLESSTKVGDPATIQLSGSLPFHSGGAFCLEEGLSPLTGSFTVATPFFLSVDS